MATHKVHTPDPAFRGEVAGVYFHDGVATVNADDPANAKAMAYFTRRYQVETVEAETQAEAQVVSAGDAARPKDYATKAEWVAYAVAQGADPTEAEALTKADLVDQYGNTSTEEELS